MKNRTTYHTYSVVNDHRGHSKNTESFDVFIVIESKRVARGKGHMKNRTTHHTYCCSH